MKQSAQLDKELAIAASRYTGDPTQWQAVKQQITDQYKIKAPTGKQAPTSAQPSQDGFTSVTMPDGTTIKVKKAKKAQ